MAEVIKREAQKPEVRDCARNLVQASSTLLSLLNGVLEIMKIDSGVLPVNQVTFSPEAILNDIIGLIKPAFEQMGSMSAAAYLMMILSKDMWFSRMMRI